MRARTTALPRLIEVRQHAHMPIPLVKTHERFNFSTWRKIMSNVRRTFLIRLIAGGIALVGLAPTVTVAQTSYPDRSITLVVPYPAGGGSDNVARLVAAKLEQTLGQPVVVENRSGAGGNIGTRLIANAKPDGYTIGLATPGPVSVGKSLYTNLPYDPTTALIPVILLNESPLIMAAHGKLPITDNQSFTRWAAARGDGINAGIGGTGSVNHLMTALYRIESGTRLVDVPYKGGAEAVTNTIAGHVDVLFIPVSAVLSAVSVKQLVPLFITSAARSPLMPDVPAAPEMGLKNVVGSAWNGIVVPAGTPREVVERLNNALNAVLQRDDVRESFRKQGLETKGGSAQDFKIFIEADAKKWREVITTAKIERV